MVGAGKQRDNEHGAGNVRHDILMQQTSARDRDSGALERL